MKKILIIGGAGFIGSHLAEAYLDKGYHVIVVDNLSTGKLSNLVLCNKSKNFQFIECDITNFEKIKSIIVNVKPNIINHLAAQKSVAESVVNPKYDLNVNLIGLINILMVLKDIKIESFIFASSGGALSKEIIRDCSSEDDEPQLKSPYAITKYASENYIKIYAELYKFDYTILRYANVYGFRQTRDGACGVIPIFIEKVKTNSQASIMTYEDMPYGCTRDYVYIKDVVRANLMVSDNPLNCIVNISTGKEISTVELYEKIVKVFNGLSNYKITSPRLGDIKRSVLSYQKVKDLIGWESKYDLESGLKEIKFTLEGTKNVD